MILTLLLCSLSAFVAAATIRRKWIHLIVEAFKDGAAIRSRKAWPNFDQQAEAWVKR
jgi:hypothetical protein